MESDAAQEKVALLAMSGRYFSDARKSRMDVAGPSRDVGVTAADVEVKDGVLWALASKHLLRFDGASWEVFEHIDNVPC
jgi:hypothetical protein